MEAVVIREDQLPAVPTQDQAGVAAPPLPLDVVLQQIRRDSRDNPQQYLDETTVPFGGE